MKIYYATLTGNCSRFIARTGLEATNIQDEKLTTEPFVLVTYTFGFGAVPEDVKKWLDDNHQYLRGVAVSGNKNWGGFYGMAGEIIAKQYNVPLLLKFELSGTKDDAELFKRKVDEICDISN